MSLFETFAREIGLDDQDEASSELKESFGDLKELETIHQKLQSGQRVSYDQWTRMVAIGVGIDTETFHQYYCKQPADVNHLKTLWTIKQNFKWDDYPWYAFGKEAWNHLPRPLWEASSIHACMQFEDGHAFFRTAEFQDHPYSGLPSQLDRVWEQELFAEHPGLETVIKFLRETDKFIISGSSIMHILQKWLHRMGYLHYDIPNWRPNDVDLYIAPDSTTGIEQCEGFSRYLDAEGFQVKMKPLCLLEATKGNLRIQCIFTTNRNLPSFVEAFDLPVIQHYYDPQTGKFWSYATAMYQLITGRVEFGYNSLIDSRKAKYDGRGFMISNYIECYGKFGMEEEQGPRSWRRWDLYQYGMAGYESNKWAKQAYYSWIRVKGFEWWVHDRNVLTYLQVATPHCRIQPAGRPLCQVCGDGDDRCTHIQMESTSPRMTKMSNPIHTGLYRFPISRVTYTDTKVQHKGYRRATSDHGDQLYEHAKRKAQTTIIPANCMMRYVPIESPPKKRRITRNLASSESSVGTHGPVDHQTCTDSSGQDAGGA